MTFFRKPLHAAAKSSQLDQYSSSVHIGPGFYARGAGHDSSGDGCRSSGQMVCDGRCAEGDHRSGAPVGVCAVDPGRPGRSAGEADGARCGRSIARRMNGQIAWFDKKAAGYRDAATLLRRVEFGLALAATLITAIASVIGKTAPLWGVQFDFAAFTAVLTTVAAAVLAHVEASRFDFLVTTYLATARRLENRRNRSQEP